MKRLILFISFLLLSIIPAMAQGGPPPGSDNNPPSPPGGGNATDIPAPIDNHIWIILLVGLVFGLYMVLSKKFALKD
ncbi:MAG: hypothetical protein R6V36_01660 [Psychroflexus sp.]